MNNRDANHDAVVVAAARTAIGRAKRGSLASSRPDDMAAEVFRGLVDRVDNVYGLYAEIYCKILTLDGTLYAAVS